MGCVEIHLVYNLLVERVMIPEGSEALKKKKRLKKIREKESLIPCVERETTTTT